MERWQRFVKYLLLLLLIEQATYFTKAEDSVTTTQEKLSQDQSEKWSKPATAQRRQGDWIPVPCPGCQPLEELPNRDGISSVLTPPARLQEPRLLPPPLPSESLYQQAATAGFLQTFQQPPPFNNKGRQQQIPLQGGQFIQQPVQQNQQFNQHREHNNQNQHNTQFLNQQQNLPVFQINPQTFTQSQHAQILNQPVLNVPQQSLPPHYISGFIPPVQQPAPAQFQQANIAQDQQSIPISVPKSNFQNQPVFNQDSSSVDQNSNLKHQQLDHQRRPIDEHSSEEQQKVQQQVFNNGSVASDGSEENEEVQLLYVPVEQLRQRGRNLGRPKQNNQFQTINLPANFAQQATINTDNLNLPSSPGNAEVYHQNKQNNQFHQQQNVHFNQAPIEQEFPQNKPNLQYKPIVQSTPLGSQGFPQNNPNIQYSQQAFIPPSKNSQVIPQNKPNTQPLQLPLTSTFEDSEDFEQNKKTVQYEQPGFTSSQEEIYRQQEGLQKSQEKGTQSQFEQDLPQVRTSEYTTPSAKKHKFHKSKENIEQGQHAQQQYLQETTHDIPPKSPPATAQLEPNQQNYNYDVNNQEVNFETNNQRFRTEPNNQQFYQANEQEFKARARQQIPPRQNEQIYQHQQSSKTVESQEYITKPSSTIPPPHQPPLSVYMESGENSKVSDVLHLLKNAKTIPVLDTVGPESPQVFVGPSNLDPPNGYIKFELPYLSSLENNRVERKVDRLPFFVAPLNFNPPPGYSKIPFPAPHIGSVVVSNVTILREALHEKPYIVSPSPISSTTRTYSDAYTLPADISPISPQLPSLVNSLQDEIYSPPGSTEPTTTPSTTTTTEVYTTPYYRRTQSRGSHRGHSNYQTSTTTSSPRRVSSRTRRPYNGRPYSHRQPVTTTTTTPIPTTEEVDVPQAEEQIYDTQPLFSQSNEQATNFKEGQQYTQNGNQYQNQQFDTNVNYDSVEENNTPQIKAQNYGFSNQNAQKDFINVKTQQISNVPETQFAKDINYNNYDINSQSTPSSVTTESAKVVPSFQGIRNENAFQSQRANNPRRENPLRNQRLRGRGHHRSQPTTTTEASVDSTSTDNQYNSNTYQEARVNENPFNYRNHKYTEVNDQIDVKTQNQQSNYKYPIQTERSDIIQTTESQEKYVIPNQKQFDQSIQSTHFNRPNQNEYVQQNQFQQNINAPQQTQTESDEVNSKKIQQYQLQSAQVLNNNQDYSGHTRQPVSQSQNSAQPVYSQNVQSFNNQQYLAQTPNLQSPQVHSPQRQESQPVQNYNIQNPQISNSKNNQQDYYDEAQPTQTKSTHSQNLDEQQYFAQVQSKQASPQEIQPNTQQSYLGQVQQPQQKQQISQEQYQPNNQNDQRHHHIQNPKFAQQDYDVNFQSQTGSISQSDYSAINRNVQPTEATSQYESSNEQNPQQSESQFPSIDSQQSVSSRPHNQQRLTKYTRSRSRTPINSQHQDETHSQGANLQGESQYQNADGPVFSTQSSITEAEEATTKSSLVRVRGRVRSRQRGQPRTHYSTTTEVPNYPVNVLRNEYSTEQPDEQISNTQYNPQKRVNKNFKSRQPYDSQEFSNTEQTIGTGSLYNSQAQPISTTEASTTEATINKPTRRYKHVLNRNIQRRPTRPTQSPPSQSSAQPTSLPNSVSSGNTKYLVRTTRRPPTRLSVGRARIRKPTTTTTTTELSQPANPSWVNTNDGSNFAPSAASNEVIDPYYSNKNEPRPVYNHYEEQVKPSVRAPVAPVKSPAVKTVDDDDYWNQAVTIQQSTSYDFKPDPSAVTQSSFQGTFEPSWDDQLGFKNDNYYDNYNAQTSQQSNQGSSLDQTPFPSNEQQVVYTEIKSRPHVGKENQWNEKELLDKKKQDDNENVESLREPEETGHLTNGEVSQSKKEVVTSEEGSSENESTEKTTAGILSESNAKDSTFADRISTSTEVDKSFTKAYEETKLDDPVTPKKPGRRRGSWVRVRVKKPQDLFETAESQNLATLSGNAIQASTKPAKDKTSWKVQETTTVPTTASTTSEPEETVDFEEALTSMLKDFITQTDSDSEAKNTTTEDTIQPTTNSNDSATAKSTEHILTETTDTTERKEETVITTLGIETTTDPIPTPELTTVVIPLVGDNSQITTDSVYSTADVDVYETLPSRVIGTSTTTEISLETEICYRGRCVKTKTENESDLLTTE